MRLEIVYKIRKQVLKRQYRYDEQTVKRFRVKRVQFLNYREGFPLWVGKVTAAFLKKPVNNFTKVYHLFFYKYSYIDNTVCFPNRVQV